MDTAANTAGRRWRRQHSRELDVDKSIVYGYAPATATKSSKRTNTYSVFSDADATDARCQ